MKKFVARLIAVMTIAMVVGGCAPQTPPQTEQQQSAFASQWIGKRRREVVAQFGQPTTSTPLLETGGELLTYAKQGQPRYVFETGPEATVVKAIEMP
jgi:hypothetical protein